MKATVYADNNLPVRFRMTPSTTSPIIAEIPQGEKVTVLNDNGKWSQIEYHNETGYMMSKFLIYGNTKLASLKTKLKEVLQILDTLED